MENQMAYLEFKVAGSRSQVAINSKYVTHLIDDKNGATTIEFSGSANIQVDEAFHVVLELLKEADAEEGAD
jgi:hypothetical protein